MSEAICAFQDDITLMGMADKVAGMVDRARGYARVEPTLAVTRYHYDAM